MSLRKWRAPQSHAKGSHCWMTGMGEEWLSRSLNFSGASSGEKEIDEATLFCTGDRQWSDYGVNEWSGTIGRRERVIVRLIPLTHGHCKVLQVRGHLPERHSY